MVENPSRLLEVQTSCFCTFTFKTHVAGLSGICNSIVEQTGVSFEIGLLSLFFGFSVCTIPRKCDIDICLI
jgi:hypothetical protein